MAYSLRVFHCLTPQKNLLLVLALVLGASSQLMAQCDRIGRVVSITPGCGALVKDLSTGQFFRAVSGIDVLAGGETIRFGMESVPNPNSPGCIEDGVPTVELSCLGDLQAAEAQFSYFANPLNPLQYTFKAELAHPTTQSCQWSFGEGPLVDFPGNIIQHTFPQPGAYTICLKITDENSITTHRCQEIMVSTQAANLCGYDAFMTSVGNQVYAKLLPQNSSAGAILNIAWSNGENGPILGEMTTLNAPLPDAGNYSICAKYKVESLIGDTTCSTSICKSVTVLEQGCAIPQMVNSEASCLTEIVPVCGCDNITYEKECEALAAGLTTWWEGDCNSIYGSCMADVEIKVVAGNPDEGYMVQFRNLSVGNFNLTHLDFGDGSRVWEGTNWNVVLHHYAKSDVYRIDLSVWKQNNCASTVTKIFTTDVNSLTPANLTTESDYVLPGDANGDKKANVYDLLNIGVGYLDYGAPRPVATTDWTPQFAANWPKHLASNLNYKHFDCDGDGMILDLDVDVIEPHYSPIDSSEVAFIPGAPTVSVKFEQDTIFIDPNNPQPLTINASVEVGNSEVPALGLYGLAFALKYPEYVEHDPEVEYKNDFFGISNHMLWLPKDNYDRRQLDLGFTQKYQSVSGYGSIATLVLQTDFIIIIDIIERANGDAKAFTVPIRGLKAINADGEELELGASAVQDTVWIKLLQTTSTHDQNLQEQVHLYPNPATGETRILTGDLDVERIEVTNVLGQIVYSATPSGGQVQRLVVTGWASGLYKVRLQTTQGIVEKKLMVR